MDRKKKQLEKRVQKTSGRNTTKYEDEHSKRNNERDFGGRRSWKEI